MLMFERLLVRTADVALRNPDGLASRLFANGLATGVRVATGANVTPAEMFQCGCWGLPDCTSGGGSCSPCDCGCPSGGSCWMSSECLGECCDYDCGDYSCVQYVGDEC